MLVLVKVKVKYHTSAFHRPRNSKLKTLTDSGGSQVTEGSVWAVPGQEITSSASPFNALILSHCTSKITAGSRQRQGVSHHRREDMIDLTLRDIVSSHPTSCPCHSLPPWGLVWCLHSKLETALWYRQLIRASKV